MADKPQKGVAGDDTGGKTRRAIREMLKKGATIESIAAAADRDSSTIEQILRGSIENPPSDLAGKIRNAKIIKKKMSYFSAIFELQENKSKRVQIAKIGAFNHIIYGKFSITAADLEEMKTNFEADVRKQKIDGRPVLPFDYSHYDGDKAAGWITALSIESGSLFAEVEWTPKAAEKIKNKEFRFVSPSIHSDYKDAETGKKYKIVLMGAALTNVPFLRDMEAIHLLSEGRRAAFNSLKLSGDNPDAKIKQGSNMPDFKKILEELRDLSPEDRKKLSEAVEAESKKLSEDTKKEKEKLEKKSTEAADALKLSEKELKTLKEKMSGSDDVTDRLKLSEGQVKDLAGKVSSLTKTLAENAQKSEFDKMLSEGKVCEAQRKSFLKGDMAEFAKNAQAVKLSEKGENPKGDETVSKAEEKVKKLAEAKMKDDENMEYGDAVSLVLDENSDLNRKIYPQE